MKGDWDVKTWNPWESKSDSDLYVQPIVEEKPCLEDQPFWAWLLITHKMKIAHESNDHRQEISASSSMTIPEYTPTELTGLCEKFQQKGKETITAWLLYLWDIGGYSASLNGSKAEKMSSIVTYRTLW